MPTKAKTQPVQTRCAVTAMPMLLPIPKAAPQERRLKCKLLVFIPTRGVVCTEWAKAFRQLRLPPETCIVFREGTPIQSSRNAACRHMLEAGAEELFFLDDDTIPPPEAYDLLHMTGADIVSGLYFQRNPPMLPLVIKKQDDDTAGWFHKLPDAITMDADRVPAGCLLIQRRVLEKVTYPWFDYTADRWDLPAKDRKGEDYYFCDKAKEAGFNIVANLQVRCRHAGMGYTDDGVFRPLSVN